MNYLTLTEHLAITKLKSPTPETRKLLAYIHGGEVLRHFLPKLLRIFVVVVWLVFHLASWLVLSSAIYEEYERWGLVRAFFAQMISLAAAALVTIFTIYRARHLEMLPVDDFAVLRATSVLCRWFAEVALVYVMGMWLRSLLQDLGPLLSATFGDPEQAAASPGSGPDLLDLISGGVSGIVVMSIIPVFLFFYAIANAIDISLAIEFNTRASGDRTGAEPERRAVVPIR